MPPIIRNAPTPRAFADAFSSRIIEPEVKEAAGSDGKLSATDVRTARDDGRIDAATAAEIDKARRAVGSRTPSVEAVVAAAREEALASATRAAGPDGRLSLVDARALSAGERAGYETLRGRTTTSPENRPAAYSERVLADVAERHSVDAQALLAHARASAPADRYLSRTDLEAAARTLRASSEAELGIISDIDKTVLPPEVAGAMPPPYPGVSTLFREIEFMRNGSGGDTHYVTARNPERAAPMPAWFAEHGLPEGNIETGTSSLPWVAQPEKVKDISAIFEANPDQRFVLFGDSSHRDPEVYKEIRSKYPDQVAAVVILKMTNVNATRVEGMHLVESYAHAAGLLIRDGVLDRASARRVIDAARSEGLTLSDTDAEALLNG